MTVFFRFGLHLKNFDIDEMNRPEGPLFHRWLPDGLTDALVIPTADERNQLTAWFRRRGHVQDSFIRYSDKSEVDATVMRRQNRLDAGPLLGEARYVNVSSEELDAMRADAKDTSPYIAVGKRVAAFVAESVGPLIDRLRTHYGQYWLPELHPWDARSQSLGSYCSGLQIEWREADGEPWRKFRPTGNVTNITVAVSSTGDQYLTESDWRSLQQTFKPQAASLALSIFARAHELHDTGHVAEALVQAVTAVELAVNEYVAGRIGALKIVASLGQFEDLPLKTKVAILLGSTNLLPLATVEDIVAAINLRNDIVHEGKRPQTSTYALFGALAKCVSALAGPIKTPSLHEGHSLSDPPSTS